jgi:uncharacterized iron-regulated membrane protein
LHATSPPGAARLPVASLVAAVAVEAPDFTVSSVTLEADPTAPAAISGGRGGPTLFVNPYSGAVLGEGATGLDQFFGAVTGWHRWFNASGENRALWRAITGASNLAFLFLILSGIYLWLPRTYKWAMFRARLFFSASALSSGAARDFNWHHVLGMWTAIPLAVVVATATVFYYSWANALVYRAFGEEPPQSGGPRAAAAAAQGTAPQPLGSGYATGTAVAANGAPAEAVGTTGGARALDALFDVAANQLADWRSITIQLPRPGDATVQFTIDQGNGGQPQLRHTLTLDAESAAVASWQPFESQTPGRQARSWVRFLHTGEALGIVGQTIAGLVSLTSTVMVWTGLALAYRRLVSPLLARKRIHLTSR